MRVKAPVQHARHVPKARRLPVRDEEYLPRDLQGRVVRARKRRVRELVELAPHGGPWHGGLVRGVLPVRQDLLRVRRRGNVGPEWARERGRDAPALRRRVDGGEPDVEFVLETLEVLLRVRDEAVSGKQMRVRAVADIRPVEEVRVVADLDVRLAALPRLEEPCDELPVTRPRGGRGEIGARSKRDALDEEARRGLTRRCLLGGVRQCRDLPGRLPRGRSPLLWPWTRYTGPLLSQVQVIARRRQSSHCH